MSFPGRRFDAGDSLPDLPLTTLAHGDVSVPSWFGDRWGVLLVYRAGW